MKRIERPTAPGLYLLRCGREVPEWTPVDVWENRVSGKLVIQGWGDLSGYHETAAMLGEIVEWAGPIPYPEEPTG